MRVPAFTLFSVLAFFSVALLAENATTSNIERAVFTTAVVDREPVDDIGQLKNDVNKIFFYTEITGMTGENLVHRWRYNGELKAEIAFTVGAERWRFWSSKKLLPEWVGRWTVEVVDSDERILYEHSMAFIPANIPGN